MVKFFQAGGHYLVGLATIGSMSGLAAVGVVSAAEAVTVITGVASLLIGGKLGATVPGSATSA